MPRIETVIAHGGTAWAALAALTVVRKTASVRVYLDLDLTDGQDVFRALVKELHELSIEFVNGFAMFGDVQGEAVWELKS